MVAKMLKNPFVSSQSPLDKGLKFFRDSGKGNKTSTTRYGYIDMDGNGYPPNNTACHAGLSHPTSGPKTEYIVNWIDYREKVTPEIKRAFTEWLVNFSPFRNIFVEHDIEQIMKDEFVIASVDHPYNLLAGGLQALRAMSEHSQTSIIWYHLVKNGVHPNLAFYISYSFKTDGKDLYPGYSSHTGCFDESYCVNREVLVNILTENYVKLTDSYRSTKSYSSAHILFGTKGVNIIPSLIKSVDATVNKVKGTANPFAKPKTNSRWPFEKGIKALADAINTEFKKELEKLHGKA